MAFTIDVSNKHGIFKLSLERNLGTADMMAMAQLAGNLLLLDGETATEESSPDEEGYSDLLQYASETNTTGRHLGENPVDSISMGGYKPPTTGVRIKMVAPPEKSNMAKAVKAFRNETGISLLGCKHIIFGNFECPILDPGVAFKIMKEFKELEVYAKIVPADQPTVVPNVAI